MSIIYDALNKVEKTNPHSPENKPGKGKPRDIKLYVLYGLILILGFIGAKAIASFVFISVAKKEAVVKQPGVVVKKEVLSTHQPVVSGAERQAETQPVNQPISQPVKGVKDIEPPPMVLNGVFISPDEKYAIINNQIVREGDKIDGAIVLSISESEVEVDYEGLKISLTSSKK